MTQKFGSVADGVDPKRVYNTAPVSKVDNYAYWKENIHVNILLTDKNVWVVVTDKPFIPKGGNDVIKHPKD